MTLRSLTRLADWSNKSTRILWRCLAVPTCVFQMWFLAIEFSRHWSAMGPYTHAYAIVYLCCYPGPCFHLFRREPQPWLFALGTYSLLMLAALLVFPILP